MQSYSEQLVAMIEDQVIENFEDIFAQAMANDSDDTLFQLANYLQSMGFIEEAKEIYENLLEKYPDVDEIRVSLAEIAIDNGEIDQAFSYLDLISEESSAYLSSLLTLADLYQLIDMPDVSEQKLLLAKSLYPEEPLITFALAELYYVTGKYQEAFALYQELKVSKWESLPSISLNERLGSSAAYLGELATAIEYLEAAKIENESPDVLYRLAFVYKQQHEEHRAIELWKRVLELDPYYHAVYRLLGETLLDHGHLEEAERYLTEGVNNNPYEIELYLLLAEVSDQLHHEEKAEDLLLSALKFADEEKTDILFALSNIYLKTEEYQKLVELLSQYEISNDLIAWNLAEAYNQLEEYDLARENYEKAEVTLNDNPDFLKDFGLFLREDGDFTRSRGILERYNQLIPDDVEISQLLGEWGLEEE